MNPPIGDCKQYFLQAKKGEGFHLNIKQQQMHWSLKSGIISTVMLRA